MASRQLPPEILSEIVSHFQEHSQLPNETPDSERQGYYPYHPPGRKPAKLGCHDDDDTHARTKDVFQLLHTPHPIPARTKDLQAMMLVNHEWHNAVSRELYKVIRLPIVQSRKDEDGKKVYRAGWEWLLSKDNKTQSPLIHWRRATVRMAIRHVKFDFNDQTQMVSSYRPSFTDNPWDVWKKPLQNTLFARYASRADYDLPDWSEGVRGYIRMVRPDVPPQKKVEAAEAALSCFPAALRSLPPHLSTLEVRMPPWCFRVDEVQVTVPIEPDLNHARLQAIVSAVSSVLADATALPNLTDLRLMFTGTKDFADLARDVPPSAPLWNRLRRLLLVVTDASGEGGEYMDKNNDHFDREDETKSSYQRAWPNQRYGGALWEIVERCKNLRSLGIRATHALDSDSSDVNWIDAVAGKLEVLFLTHIKIDLETLNRLIRRNDQEHSPLEAIFLKEVLLKGTDSSWLDVLQEIKQCNRLRYCGIASCYYQEDNDRWTYQPQEDDVAHVWTELEEEETRDIIRSLPSDLGSCPGHSWSEIPDDLDQRTDCF